MTTYDIVDRKSGFMGGDDDKADVFGFRLSNHVSSY